MRARTSEHLNTLLYCLFFLLLILTVIPAQEISHPLSSNGTDPTEPRTRFGAYLGSTEPLSAGYIIQSSAMGNWAFNHWGSIGLSVPLVYADFPSSVTFEVGDLELKTLFAFYKSKKQSSLKSIALGVDFFLNTGNVETGTGFGQYVVGPYLAASFFPSPEIMLTPIIEEFISLDKDDKGNKKNDLSLRIQTTYNFEQGIWLTLTPELIIDLLGEKANLWTLRSSIGKMINQKSGFSFDYISQLAGEKRFNYLARINYRYLIK